MGNRAEAVKQYKKSENHWEKELKDLKKQNRILYSIAKKSSSRRELKISRISRLRLPRSTYILAATVTEVNRIMISPSLLIVTENNRYIPLNVRR